jgi:hypothetical protein
MERKKSGYSNLRAGWSDEGPQCGGGEVCIFKSGDWVVRLGEGTQYGNGEVWIIKPRGWMVVRALDMAAEKSGYSYLEAGGQVRALNVMVEKSGYSYLEATGQVRALDVVVEKSVYSNVGAGWSGEGPQYGNGGILT